MVTTAEINILLKSRDQTNNIIGKMNRDLEQTSKVASNASAQVKGFGGTFTSAIGTIGRGLGTIGLAGMGISTVTSAVKGLGNALGFGLQNELEQVRASMNAFFKDSGKTEEALKLVREEANKTPFAFREMATAMSSLLPVSKQANVNIMDLVKTAEILAASNPFEGLEGASFSLREAMTGDFTSIIERFNLSRTTINKLKAEGVPALEIVRKAMQEMGFDADLVAAKAQTMSGRWSTFNDTLDTLRMKLSEKLFEGAGKALDMLSTGLNKNMGLFESMAEFVGNVLGAAFTGLITILGNVATFVSGTLVPAIRDGLVAVWGQIGPAVTGAASAIQSGLQTAVDWVMNTAAPAIVGALSRGWEVVGPAAAAGASAIQSALSGVMTWVRDTAAPAIVGALSRGWDTVQPAVSGAATAITNALGEAKDWVERQWPSVKSTIIDAFQDTEGRIGQALEAIRSGMADTIVWAEENWPRVKEAIGSAFEQVQSAYTRVLKDIIDAQRTVIEEMQRDWQEFGESGGGGGSSLFEQVMSESLGRILDLWRTTFGVLITVVQEAWPVIINSVTQAQLLIINALTTIRAFLSGEWSLAWENAKQVVQNWFSIVTGGLPVIETLGRLISSAATSVGTLASGLGTLAGAAVNAIPGVDRLRGALETLASAAGKATALIPHSIPPLAQGIKDTGEHADMAAPALHALGTEFAFLTEGSRKAMSDILGLDLELAKLRVELSHTEAYSEARTKIEEQIRFIEGWRNQLTALEAVQRIEQQILEEQKTALDGAREAWDKLAASGDKATNVFTLLGKAFSENDAASGQEALGGLTAWLDSVKTFLGEKFPEAAAFARFAFFQALGAVTEEERQFWLAQLQGLVTDTSAAMQALADEAKAKGEFTAANFAAAFVEAGAWEDLKNQLGTVGANVIKALETAWKEGGERNIKAAADAVAQLREVYKDLPDYIRDRLGPEMTTALNEFLVNPTQEGLKRLKPVIRQITELQGLIPKDLAKMAPEVQARIREIVQAYMDGAITIEEAAERIKAANDTIAASAVAAAKAAEALNLALSQSGALSAQPSMASGFGMVPTQGIGNDSVAWLAATLQTMAGLNAGRPGGFHERLSIGGAQAGTPIYDLLAATGGHGEGGYTGPRLVAAADQTNKWLKLLYEEAKKANTGARGTAAASEIEIARLAALRP